MRRNQVYQRVNDALWERYRRGEIDAAGLRHRRFVEFLHETGSDPRLAPRLAARYERDLARRAHPYPGCRATLRLLGRHFRLGLVTNGLTRIQHGRLRAAGIRGHFATVVTSEACGIAKPDPRILHVALRRMRVEPHEAVYVGDDPAVDHAAARDAGVPFVWVDRGRHRARGPRRRVTHLREVPGLLL